MNDYKMDGLGAEYQLLGDGKPSHLDFQSMKLFEENELAIQRQKTEKRINNIKRFRY